MIVLDSSIVNVALPWIQTDLGFSQAALAWVVNAYLLTFGGFLLLPGRLGDLLSNKRVFLGGVVSFTVACDRLRIRAVGGAAGRPPGRPGPRRRRGLGGGAGPGWWACSPTEQDKRAKAMTGIFGFVMSGGGAVGVLLGGVLTGLFSWHWIFLVNVPIGVGVWLAARRVLPADEASCRRSRRLDVLGAVLVTAAPDAQRSTRIVGGNEAGWTSSRTLLLLGGGIALLRRVRGLRGRGRQPAGAAAPVPRSATSSVSQFVGVLWAAAMFAWFFLAALYLQQGAGVRRPGGRPGLHPDQRGDGVLLAAGLRQAGDALRHPPAAGRRAWLLAAVSLGAVLAARRWAASFVVDVLPSMLLLGAGAGIAFNPVLLAAMGDVEPHEAGLASGARQHVVHDGRRARPGRAGQHLHGAHRQPAGRRNGAGRGAQRRAAGSPSPPARSSPCCAAVVGGVFLRPKPMAVPDAVTAPSSRRSPARGLTGRGG